MFLFQLSKQFHNLINRLIFLNSPQSPSLRWAALLTMGLLGACTSSEKVVCFDKDWYEIGRQEGIRGEKAETAWLGDKKGCTPSAISQAKSRFTNGHIAGLMVFCSANNGFEMGFNGETYKRVCPMPIENSFLSAYRNGLEVRRLHDEQIVTESKILSLQNLKQEILMQKKSTQNIDKQIENLKSRQSYQSKLIDNLRKSI